jgi:glycosyltransferase involved in cell wall biosynthesis
MSAPLVSIITPTYNHSKYIIDCIRSVQAQRFTNWEMLIINDGSTDSTADLVAEYIKNEPRVKLFSRQNVGIFRLAETYNFALGMARGTYIAILEGDDLWEPEKLARQVEVLEKRPEVVLAWGKVASVNSDLSETLSVYPPELPGRLSQYNNTPVGNILNHLLLENCIGALSITMRKAPLVQAGGFLQGFGLPLVDLPTIMAMSLQGEFYYDSSLLGKWRVFPYQITKTYPVEILKGRYALSLEKLGSLTAEQKKVVTVTAETVNRYFKRILLVAYARSGRYKLIRKDFKGARKDYSKAIFFNGPVQFTWRLRALIGYMFSLFRLNVEGLAGLLGKVSYK